MRLDIKRTVFTITPKPDGSDKEYAEAIISLMCGMLVNLTRDGNEIKYNTNHYSKLDIRELYNTCKKIILNRGY